MNDDRLLVRIVAALAAVPGIRAIVLGGSRARGTATPYSDYDTCSTRKVARQLPTTWSIDRNASARG